MPSLSINIAQEELLKVKGVSAFKGRMVADNVVGRALGAIPFRDGINDAEAFAVFGHFL